MVTIVKKLTGGAYPFYEYACLSTDVKPASLVPENSICHEIDTGKHFYFGNGEWKELPPKGGSGGGSQGGGSGLPEPTRSGNIMQVSDDTGEWEQVAFPLADEDNVGKLIGITSKDGVYKYSSVPAPSGGGAEKFIVTLTQDEQTEEWTADKTVAEIFTAYGAEKNVVVHAERPIDIFCTGAFNMGNMKFVTFGCVTMDGTDPNTYAVLGYENQGTDAWMVNESRLPTDGESYVPAFSTTNNGQVLGVYSGSLAWVASNAPLVVTLTAGQEAGQFVGDKTHQEVFEAFIAGRSVILYASSLQVAASVTLVDHSASNYVISSGDAFTSEGDATDYITVTAGG